MLTLEEVRWSLNCFKVFSILNVLPIGVDVKGGKIQRQPNKVKVFVWKILFGVGVLHWFYIFGRLVQSTIFQPEKYFRWDHFVFHFGNTCAYAAFYFTGFRLFVKNAEENVMIFNQLFKEREDPVQKMVDQEEEEQELQRQAESKYGNGKQENKKSRVKSGTRILSISAQQSPQASQKQNEVRARPLLTWPPQYSLDELVAKIIAVCAVCSGFCIILFLAIDPSRPQLLYSVLPPAWQNGWSFLSLLAAEKLCISIPLFSMSFAFVAQLLFFGKCQLEFKRMSLQLRNLREKFQNRSVRNGARDLEKEIWILRQILEEMRELVVLIELFNRCFPFCIFAWKICSLSNCILFYFFVIRHFQDFPILAAFIGYVAIAITLTYTIMYSHAFSIPGKMDDLKNEFLLTAQKTTSNPNVNKNLWAAMKRKIGGIRGVGIKVGSFHQMERESTPNFIDFVFNQVVSLLVTFP